jgi:hypothetical protein
VTLVATIPAGPNLKAICPFHQAPRGQAVRGAILEQPSVSISFALRRWRCLACGAEGQAFIGVWLDREMPWMPLAVVLWSVSPLDMLTAAGTFAVLVFPFDERELERPWSDKDGWHTSEPSRDDLNATRERLEQRARDEARGRVRR